MTPELNIDEAGETSSRPLYVFNGGFLWQPSLREILSSAGYRTTFGLPRAGDLIGVWGQSPTSHRGASIAAKRQSHLVRIEDAFLRSLRPGRSGERPLGLLIDHSGVHFDASRPSDLENLLQAHPLDNSADLARARTAMERMIAARLSKYSGDDPTAQLPDPGYVLVIDQTKGDASVTASGGDRNRFLEMLFCAREENPRARILIKAHPETTAGYRNGHYQSDDAQGPVEICDANIAPMALLEGATRVYTLSSQMGFEAIISGHKPRVFGTPFYAGWGLTIDETVIPRRRRTLTPAQLFLAAMILYPVWFDPYLKRRCEIEDIVSALEAQTRAWRADFRGWIAQDIRLWKRFTFQRYFGQHQSIIFTNSPSETQRKKQTSGRPVMVWGNRAVGTPEVYRVEDGFLRSKGLGAELIPPLSLVTDSKGIYFDPAQKSDLEREIIEVTLSQDAHIIERSRGLLDNILLKNVTKYNISGRSHLLPEGRRILVPGQVEDDASVLMGSPEYCSNAALLEKTRLENPDAIIIWKPHPDVEAGLRNGHVPNPERFADVTLLKTPISEIYPQVQEVWTLTSLAGFEALIRGCKVTTLGLPFYAGWGLTQDLCPIPERRRAAPRPCLEHLVYAALIAYPRYWDPVTGLPCPAEIAIERLAAGKIRRPSLSNRLLSKAQGALASHAHIWRR